MSRLWKHRPSPAMIVAMLALFVAMGGTGYAVSKLPKGSVGSAQIRKNAVRAKHIKAGSITTAKLAQSTLSALRAPVAAPALAASRRHGSRGAARLTESAYADKAGYRGQGRHCRQGDGIADMATGGHCRQGGRRQHRPRLADHAKLADNATQLGGKSVADFLTSDTIRWVEPFTIAEGTKEMLKVGSVHAHRALPCQRDDRRQSADQDQADIIISTTQAKSAFDGDDLLGSLDPGDNIETRQFVNTSGARQREPRFEASSDGLAIGGDGKRLHQGLVPVRRHEHQRRDGQVQVRRLHLPLSRQRSEPRLCTSGGGAQRRPSCVPAGAGTRRRAAKSPAVRNRALHDQLHAVRRVGVAPAVAPPSRPAPRSRSRSPRAPARARCSIATARCRTSSCASGSPELKSMPGFAAARRRAGAHRGRLRLPAGDGRELRAGRRARSRRGGDRALPGPRVGGLELLRARPAALRARVPRARVDRLRGHRRQHRAGAGRRSRARGRALGARLRGDARRAATSVDAPPRRSGAPAARARSRTRW